MNKTEYNNFIKRLIDNLYDVLLHSDATVDCTQKLEHIRKAVIEKPAYIFAALNPKSEVDIKFPYILVAVCYALRSLTSKAFLADMPTQNIEKLAGCVTETKKLGAPDYLGFKGINDEVYQKAKEITDMIGLRWDVAVPVFDKRAGEIDAVYKKHQEEHRTRRRYVNNTVEIEELVAVLYPNADKTIEKKIKKFWRAIERASKSNPKVKPDNWFVTEDGVKKFCRRYYDKLCIFLGITKVPRASKVCTIEELATTLYPDDAAARDGLVYRIQYLRTGASLSFADFAKLTGFFVSGKWGALLFCKGREQEFLEFLDNIKTRTKVRVVVDDETLSYTELASLVFYDKTDPKNELQQRKNYVLGQLRKSKKPEDRALIQRINSWFTQSWDGRHFQKKHYVSFFNLMRPNTAIPDEQIKALGIKGYEKPGTTTTDYFAGVPDTIDHDMDADELASNLYPKLKGARSYFDKHKSWLVLDYEQEEEYADTVYKIKHVWFYKKGKKLYLHKEYFKLFKEFMALPLRTRHVKTYAEQKHRKTEKQAVQINFGEGMSGVKALEQYLQAVQNIILEITQKRNEALERQKQHIKIALGTPGTPKNFKNIAEGVTAAQHEQIIIEDCDKQMAKSQQNASEASNLLQRARDAENAWLEINAQIKDFFLQKGK